MALLRPHFLVLRDTLDFLFLLPGGLPIFVGPLGGAGGGGVTGVERVLLPEW